MKRDAYAKPHAKGEVGVHSFRERRDVSTEYKEERKRGKGGSNRGKRERENTHTYTHTHTPA